MSKRTKERKIDNIGTVTKDIDDNLKSIIDARSYDRTLYLKRQELFKYKIQPYSRAQKLVIDGSIKQYYGTESYHSLRPFMTIATDGIKYVMDHGYSWFITDILAVIENPIEIKKLHSSIRKKALLDPHHCLNLYTQHTFLENLSEDKFLIITLNATDKNNIKMIIEDGDDQPLYIQKYDDINTNYDIPKNQINDAGNSIPDIPKNQLKMYWIDGVILLVDEY